MIELNDVQADKICEIMDVRFHHYDKAQYDYYPYYDDNPQYYFYPKKFGGSSHRLDRVTGEIRLDHDRELMQEVMVDLDRHMEKLGRNKHKNKMDKLFDDLTDKKEKVKEYLISEGLL